MATLDYYGHSTFGLTTDDGTRVIIDPFFGDNPWTEVVPSEVEADFIFCTHGHFDHFVDAIAIAKNTGATVVGTFELVEYVQSQGVENAHPMHIGGGWDFPFGRVKMTVAIHGGRVRRRGRGLYHQPCGAALRPWSGEAAVPRG